MQFQLSAWRPGRYELQIFLKTFKNGLPLMKIIIHLHFKKFTKDLWEVDTKDAMEITVTL